jgi:hypothetical protein
VATRRGKVCLGWPEASEGEKYELTSSMERRPRLGNGDARACAPGCELAWGGLGIESESRARTSQRCSAGTVIIDDRRALNERE